MNTLLSITHLLLDMSGHRADNDSGSFGFFEFLYCIIGIVVLGFGAFGLLAYGKSGKEKGWGIACLLGTIVAIILCFSYFKSCVG